MILHELWGLERRCVLRRLRRRERARLEALERLAFGGPLQARHWPPLPRERRLRVLERIHRVRLVFIARNALAAVLVRRMRAIVPPMRPCPPHGPKCPPGCAECAAIFRWRCEYEVLSGITHGVAERLWP